MKLRKFILAITATLMVVSLTACAREVEKDETLESNDKTVLKEVEPVEEETPRVDEPKVQEPVSEEVPKEKNTEQGVQRGSLSADDARALFAEYNPGVEIEVFRTQDDGRVYYMFAMSGGYKYIFKVLASDGSILVNKKIRIGR